MALDIVASTKNLRADYRPGGEPKRFYLEVKKTGVFGLGGSEKRWKMGSGALKAMSEEINSIGSSDEFKKGDEATVVRHHSLQTVFRQFQEGGYYIKDGSGRWNFFDSQQRPIFYSEDTSSK